MKKIKRFANIETLFSLPKPMRKMYPVSNATCENLMDRIMKHCLLTREMYTILFLPSLMQRQIFEKFYSGLEFLSFAT